MTTSAILELLPRPLHLAQAAALRIGYLVARGLLTLLLIPCDFYYNHFVTKDDTSLTLSEWRFRTIGYGFTKGLPIMWLNRVAPPALKRFIMRHMGTLHKFNGSVPTTFTQQKGFAGYWYTSPQHSNPTTGITKDTRIIFHAHGGGYCAGNPQQYSAVFSHWTREAMARGQDTRILSLQYTLLEVQSGRPSKTQNVATQICIDEALAGYDYLTKELGIDSKRIVLSGDSAGGNLVLALALNIRDTQRSNPAGLLLTSPWTDIDCTHWKPDNECRDWFNNYLAQTMFSWYNEHYEDLHTHPYISPIHADLRGLSPMYLWYSDHEILSTSIHKFAIKAKAEGVLDREVCDPRLFHVAPFIANWIGEASWKHLDAMIHWTEQVVDRTAQ